MNFMVLYVLCFALVLLFFPLGFVVAVGFFCFDFHFWTFLEKRVGGGHKVGWVER